MGSALSHYLAFINLLNILDELLLSTSMMPCVLYACALPQVNQCLPPAVLSLDFRPLSFCGLQLSEGLRKGLFIRL